MLEFNKEHKKADLSHTDIKNGKYKKSGKVMLGGILLSTIILFSGCSTKVDKNSNSDLNRAMISIGNEYVVVDVNEFTRWTDSNTELKLSDGTSLSVHPSDLQLYNNKSETMRNLEESVSAIYTNNPDYYIEDSGYDRAFVQIGDSAIILEISGFKRWTDSNTELKLLDGTTMNVNPMDLTLFNSKSLVMNQAAEQILNKGNSKTR